MHVPDLLSPWSNFYIMMGSSAGALTGLMFVVISLVTRVQRPDLDAAEAGVSTFSTPTVVHFGVALLVSAVLSAPWHSFVYPGASLIAIGICGLFYVFRIVLRTRRLQKYHPDLEDWVWYTGMPILAYAAMLFGGVLLFISPVSALFAPAVGVTLLIFLGIRNAWDVVTFITVGEGSRPGPD